MTLASLRDRAAAPLEFVCGQIAVRPKGVLIVWVLSLVLAAWLF